MAVISYYSFYKRKIKIVTSQCILVTIAEYVYFLKKNLNKR